MKSTVRLIENNRLEGSNSKGMKTYFDNNSGEYEQTAPTPMEILLQAVGSCSALDIISILKKQKREINDLVVDLDSDRREDYPKIFTNIRVKYSLTSSNAKESELIRAIELSQEKYCNVSILMKNAGVNLTWECELKRP